MQKRIEISKGLGKLFSFKEEETRKEIPENELVGYVDSKYIYAIIPKTYEFRDYFIKQFEAQAMEKYRVESLLKTKKEAEKNSASGVYIDAKYLSAIAQISKSYDVVKIIAKKDYPICFETKDFYLFIAPMGFDEEPF